MTSFGWDESPRGNSVVSIDCGRNINNRFDMCCCVSDKVHFLYLSLLNYFESVNRSDTEWHIVNKGNSGSVLKRISQKLIMSFMPQTKLSATSARYKKPVVFTLYTQFCFHYYVLQEQNLPVLLTSRVETYLMTGRKKMKKMRHWIFSKRRRHLT